MKELKNVLKASLSVALSVITAFQCSFTTLAQEEKTEPVHEEVVETVGETANEDVQNEVNEIDDETIDEETIVEMEVNEKGAIQAIPNTWQKSGIYWYHVNEKGEIDRNKWINTNGKWYYVGEDGILVSNRHMTINGKYYLFNEDGSQHVGWKKELRALGIHPDGDWYYYLYEGDCASDFMTINGKTYFFGQTDNGCDGAEAMKDGCLLIRGNFYYFDENGVMQKNKWIQCKTTPDVWDGKANWIYVQSDGKAVKSAWKQMNGKWYYFDEVSRMIKDSWRKINGEWYRFTESGAMAVGWHYDTWDFFMGNGTWWYYFNEDGSHETGFRTINGKTYFFGVPDGMDGGSYGIMETGCWSILNDFYYFDDNGVMQKNKWIHCKTAHVFWDGKANWIYVQSNGKAVKSAWKQINGKWYYFDELSRMVHDTTLTLNGKKYTFDSNGVWIK